MKTYETPTAPVTEPSLDIFFARQPIFAPNLQVYGFELLYRGSAENSFDNTPGDIASARVIANAVLTLGVAKLLGSPIADSG
jgi:c-di-GMP-related signal transduction protein